MCLSHQKKNIDRGIKKKKKIAERMRKERGNEIEEGTIIELIVHNSRMLLNHPNTTKHEIKQF